MRRFSTLVAYCTFCRISYRFASRVKVSTAPLCSRCGGALILGASEAASIGKVAGTQGSSSRNASSPKTAEKPEGTHKQRQVYQVGLLPDEWVYLSHPTSADWPHNMHRAQVIELPDEKKQYRFACKCGRGVSAPRSWAIRQNAYGKVAFESQPSGIGRLR